MQVLTTVCYQTNKRRGLIGLRFGDNKILKKIKIKVYIHKPKVYNIIVSYKTKGGMPMKAVEIKIVKGQLYYDKYERKHKHRIIRNYR